MNDKGKASSDALTASEALYGFMGWLTTRDESVTLGATHDASVAADLVAEFVKANDLNRPRDGWQRNLIHPATII